MTGNPIHGAYQIGQSFWLDYIRRDMLENGDLARLIADGEIRGVTSNPSIFEKAIGGSALYDSAMRPLAHAGWTPERVFENLAVHDVREATDLLLPVYEGTDGRDGFVSIEVNPQLADDTEASLEEARRLWRAVNRPNLMVKIPATPAGIPAIEQAIAEAINVNVTLIFALERYHEVMQAYLRGLERRNEDGLALDRIASVASFFVSRVDSAVDRQLELIVREEGPHAPRAAALRGHAAIANAKLAYAQFQSTFAEPRFERLRQQGARVQRPLWASTSTKNPAYSDVLYVEQLIGPDTVNTLPPTTLQAYRDHGNADESLERDLADARAQLEAIETLGISLAQVTQQLEEQGVRAFAESYEQLIDSVAQRLTQMRLELGALQPLLNSTLAEFEGDRVASRYWRADPSLWPRADGQSVVDQAEVWRAQLPQLDNSFDRLALSEVERVAWLAPGGVSWPRAAGGQQLSLESLDPAAQRSLRSNTPTASTLFVVVSRRPHDPAAEAMLASNWRRAANRLGDQAAQHFLVIAEQGSDLQQQAESLGLPLLIGDPIFTAALAAAQLNGSRAAEVVENAEGARARCAPNHRGVENRGLYLGGFLTIAAQQGRWRLGLLTDPEAEPFADWLADSLQRTGLGERVAVLRQVPVENGSEDRVLVYLRNTGELDRRFSSWVESGIPSLLIDMDLGFGGEVVRWQMGVAVAAYALGLELQPPGIEQRAAERFGRELQRSSRSGRAPWLKPDASLPGGRVWWTISEPQAKTADKLQTFAQALGQRLDTAGMLNLTLLRRRSRRLRRTLSDLGQALAGRGVDLRVGWGDSLMSSGPIDRQVSVLLCEQPKRDEPIPGQERSFGELQLMQGLAMFAELSAGHHECALISFESPATVNDWLQAVIEALS